MSDTTLPPSNDIDLADVNHTCEVISQAHDLATFCQDTERLAWVRHIVEVEIRRRNFKPDGYLYVLRAGAYYKIGRSKNPNERIKQLRIQLPFPVEVVYLFACEDAAAAEAHYHRLFDDRRANGEWFLIGDQLASFSIMDGRGGILFRRGDEFPYPVFTGELEAGE